MIIKALSENRDITDKYKSQSFSIPQQDLVDPSQKETPEYCINITKHGFSLLINDKNAIPLSNYSKIRTLRDYGSGNQDENQYINNFSDNILKESIIDVNGIDTGKSIDPKRKRTGLDHINTKILSPMQNIMDAIHGMYDDFDEDIFLDAIDASSGAEQEMAMVEAYYFAKSRQFFQELEAKTGIPLMKDNNFPSDVDPREIEVYMESGGFKTKNAEGMEQLIAYTEKKSKWDKIIKNKFIDDSFHLGFVMGRSYFDHETGEERMGYCDPENSTIEYSYSGDYDSPNYGGTFTLEKISTLTLLGFSYEQLKDAIEKYKGYFGNPKTVNWNVSGSVLPDWCYNVNVPVFHYAWIEADVYKYLSVVNEYGKSNIFNLEFNQTVKPLSEWRQQKGVQQDQFNTRIRNVYQCSWIVDTEMCYDYGRMPNQPKYRNKEPRIPFFFWKIRNSDNKMEFGSKTESLISLLDGFQEAWLKHQDSMAKAHPGGWLVNTRILQNLEWGGKPLSPKSAFDTFWKTGIFPYADLPIGGQYQGGDTRPLSRIEGSLGELLATTAQQMQFYLNQIYSISGISPALLGSSAQGNQTATESQYVMSGSQNTLKPIYTAIRNVKRDMASYLTYRIPLIIRNIPESYESYSRVVGKDVTDLIIKSERDGCEYGIFPEPRVSNEEKQRLLSEAANAMGMGRDGIAQIDYSMYMYIEEQLLAGGNLKKLRRDLAFMIRKKEEERQAYAQQNIQLQTEQQAQLKQMEVESSTQQSQLQASVEMAKIQAKGEEDRKTLAFKNEKEQEGALFTNYLNEQDNG
jgi:hypothetical protein